MPATRSVARCVSKVAVAPRHDHDCDSCRYLGQLDNDDLYYCPSGAYVVRHSSEPSDNGSFGLDMGIAPSPGSPYALAAAIRARKLPPRAYRR